MSRAFMKERDDAPEPRIVIHRAEAPEPPADRSMIGFGARVTVDSVGTPATGSCALKRCRTTSP